MFAHLYLVVDTRYGMLVVFDQDSRDILEVGAQVNAVRPNTFRGIRKAGDGFSCDVSISGLWSDHANAVMEFLSDFRDPIQRAIATGMEVAFDVALEPEDQRITVVLLEQELLSALVTFGVVLEVICLSLKAGTIEDG
jgi:hypothetical protein